MKRTEKLSRRARLGIFAAIMAGAFSIMPAAQAMPTGGDSETATIITAGNTMDIASSVTNNLLTWQDFSIAKGETVNFGGSNTYLNVVTGSNVSAIYGAITGNAANVYLINPNGILFGDGASVDVGSLHLSTADITGSLTNFDTAMDALNGADSFSGDIVNKGTLKAAQEITVDGNNITFKNTADVSAASVELTAKNNGEIHIGSADASTPAYTMTGTKYMYKLVSTAGDLQNINNDPTANYMLAKDIDASGIQKFTPIGMTAENGFTGKFDGLGYTIKGLQIDVRQLNGDSGDASNTQVLYNGAVSKVGLFSSLGAEAVVENVGLLDGSVSVTFGGDSTTANAYTVNAGSLAGVNAGTIRNVYSTNTVTVQTTERGMFYSREEGKDIKGYVGGLVGENQGTISKAYTTGAVTGSLSGEMLSVRRNAIALYVGGLAGTNSGGIAQAYHGTGTVSASLNARMDVSSYSDQSGIYAGGLVGSNAGALTNIYNTGAVSGSISSDMLIDMMEGSLHAGGIVGMQSSNGTLTSSYNTGAVSGSIKARDMIFMSGGSLLAGGIAGQAAGQITGAYNTGEVKTAAVANDVNVGPNNHDDISGGGNSTLTNTGKLEAKQATAATSYTGFNLTADGADKNAAWRIYEGTTMPLLTAFMKRKDTISSREYDGKANVGTNITAATLTSTQEKGINWVNEVNIITPKNVTITFQNADKTYDGTTEVKTVNANLDGVLDSEKENVALSATGTYDSKNAGERTVTYSSIALNGTAAANYKITGLSEGKGEGSGKITAAPLTINFADTDKQYDGTTNAVAGQGTLQGVLGNDQVSYEATAAYDSKNAGNRTVNYSGITLTGTDAGNYSIEATAEGSGKITAAPLTINFADTDKQYDGTTNAVAGQGTLQGVLGNDQVSYEATAAYDSKNAGNRTVNYSGITLTGTDAGNYSIEATAEG
ncbi:MAG: filamentous hemagglutinin N-terminal domain-containing protein, partial [Selenomonas ruminantium]|nr:filamentous hemagglutinin N-terminal domain-containing protein [Selenomonas ruminantium]